MQLLCCTNVLPPDPSVQHSVIIAVLQVSFHTLYCKDIAYIGRNREEEISGWERIVARSGACPHRYFAKEIPDCPVHHQTRPWPLVNSECWPSFPHLRNTTPLTNWADPLLPQASLFSTDMARHHLLGISGGIKGVTALRNLWLFSNQGYSITGEGLHECISAYFSANLARRAEATSCGWVGRDTWCMAAYLTPQATYIMIMWLDL